MSAPGGLVHMDTEGVTSLVERLADSGRTLADSWRGCEAGIAANEAGIGGDVLGQAFRGIYAEGSGRMRADAGRVPPAMAAQAGAGTACVADYRAADAAAAGRFPR